MTTGRRSSLSMSQRETAFGRIQKVFVDKFTAVLSPKFRASHALRGIPLGE